MDIEQLLAHCGDFGRYQWMLIFLFCLINVLASINYYSQTIITFVPEHWCYDSTLTNKSFDEIRAIYSNYQHPHCTPLKFGENIAHTASEADYWQNNDGLHALLTYASSDNQNDETIVSNLSATQCTKWIYNLDYGYTSMSIDMNWVCQNAWLSTVGQSMFFVGSVIGSLVFGVLADRIGRLRVLIAANLLAMLGNGFTAFCGGPWTFCVCRFVAGLATDSNFVMMYILVMEYLRPSLRTIGLNLCIGLFYCIGSMVSPWIAVYLGDWRTYLVVTAMPVIIVPLFYFCVQESALWLLSRNNVDAAIECFVRVAQFNRRPLSDEVIQQFRKNCIDRSTASAVEIAESAPSLLDLFRTPRLRRNTLILFFKSMVITLSYDAISRNVEGLGVTPFAMFTLSAMAIFPACVVLLLLQDWIGRKAMASGSLLLSGIFTAATGVIMAYRSGKPDAYLLVTLAVIGRFGVTMAYNSAAQYATELIPTCVRGQGLAAVHVAGYALTFFSSYILYLGNIWVAFPSIILGTLGLSGAFLVLFLPETLNRTIPSTLADGEVFGMGERICDFACCLPLGRRSEDGHDTGEINCGSDKNDVLRQSIYNSQSTIISNA